MFRYCYSNAYIFVAPIAFAMPVAIRPIGPQPKVTQEQVVQDKVVHKLGTILENDFTLN